MGSFVAQSHYRVNGAEQWQDFCVIDGMLEGPSLPCYWLQYDSENNCVYLKEKSKGEIIE